MRGTLKGTMHDALSRPVPGIPRPWAFPGFERRPLGDGLTLVVAPVHTLPLVTTIVVAPAGAATDPDGREGLSALTARAMLEGTRRREAQALVVAAERLGSSVEANADWDAAYAGFTGLARAFEPMLALLAEVVTEPSFPEREVDRLRAERLADIAQTEAEPRGLADERFEAAAYADGSRFQRPAGGTRASVAALDAEGCRVHHAARWRRAGSTVIVVGDVTADEAARRVRAAFAGWHGAVPEVPMPDDRRTAAGRRVVLVDRAEAPQSELRVGQVGVPRRHPDYFPLVLGNAVLGGLFNSRLNLNLRERHGYTYGAGSGFDWRVHAGPFCAHAAVETAVTVPALQEMLAELTRIREAPVADDELSLAQSYLEGVFPLRYETTSAIAAALEALVVYDLPDDWFGRYRERLRAVTADDVRRALAEHLDPAAWQVVVVGDAAAVREPLAAMGIGPVVAGEAP